MAIYYDASHVQRVVGGNIPNANFVMPASNPKAKLDSSILDFINRYNSLNPNEYIKGILAVCLGDMGLKSGVSFLPFKPHPEDTRNGFFHGASNSIRLRDEFLTDSSNICLAVHTISHEARHKFQQEVDVVAKYFTPRQKYMKVGDNPIFTRLCGFDAYEDPYAFYSIEQDAFMYSSKFTKIFFDELSKQFPTMSSPVAERIRAQIQSVSKKDEGILTSIHKKEMNFSIVDGRYGVKNFYNKAMPVFDSALSLAREYNYGRLLDKKDNAFASRLSAERDFGGIDIYSRAISTMGMVLGRLPQREKVEDYLNFATSCKDPKRMPEIFTALTENAVPFTPEDYTRLLLCTDYFKGRDASTFLPTSNFARVDESIWVRSMLISQGPDFTARFVSGLKNTPQASLIDFSVVDKMVAEYPKIPLLKVDDYPIYGCSELLDFALRRAIHDKRIGQGEYFTKRAELSDNLANIISHFKYCDGRNIEYLNAIFDFANNPFVKQFPDDKKDFQETNGVFSQSVSENLANYFEDLRFPHEEDFEHEEDEAETSDIDTAKRDFLAGLEKLKSSMSKEDFVAYIKSLGLSDCSRMPSPLGEDSSREIVANLSEEDLLGLGLTDEEVAELGLSNVVGDVSVIDVLQGAGKVEVRSETLVDSETVRDIAPSEYAIMPAENVDANIIKPEANVVPVVDIVPEG